MQPLSPFCFGFSSLRIDSISIDGISDHINLQGAFARSGKLTPWRCRMSYRVFNEVLMHHLPNDQRSSISAALADVLMAAQPTWDEIILRECLGRDLVLEQILLLTERGQEKSQSNPLIRKVSRIHKK